MVRTALFLCILISLGVSSASASFWDNVVFQWSGDWRSIDGTGYFNNTQWDFCEPAIAGVWIAGSSRGVEQWPNRPDIRGYGLEKSRFWGWGLGIGYRIGSRWTIYTDYSRFEKNDMRYDVAWEFERICIYNNVSGTFNASSDYVQEEVRLWVEFDPHLFGLYLTLGRHALIGTYTEEIRSRSVVVDGPIVSEHYLNKDKFSAGMYLVGLGFEQPIKYNANFFVAGFYSFPTYGEGVAIRSGIRIAPL